MSERAPNRFEVVENISVIVFEIIDERDFRQVMDELAALVEKGAIVLVPFNDEPFTVRKPRALAEIVGYSADEVAWTKPIVFEHPSQQGSGGRLAMGSGHHNSALSANKIFPEQLGERAEAQLVIQDKFGFGISTRDRVTNHYQVRLI